MRGYVSCVVGCPIQVRVGGCPVQANSCGHKGERLPGRGTGSVHGHGGHYKQCTSHLPAGLYDFLVTCACATLTVPSHPCCRARCGQRRRHEWRWHCTKWAATRCPWGIPLAWALLPRVRAGEAAVGWVERRMPDSASLGAFRPSSPYGGAGALIRLRCSSLLPCALAADNTAPALPHPHLRSLTRPCLQWRPCSRPASTRGCPPSGWRPTCTIRTAKHWPTSWRRCSWA